MHKRDSRPVPGVGEIGKEGLELQRGEHALVDDRRAGQAGQVQAGLVLSPLAQAVRLPVQLLPRFSGQPRHDQLDKLGQHLGGPVPAIIGVVRHVAPAEYGQPFVGREPLDGRLHLGPAQVRWQEAEAGHVAADGRQVEVALGPQQFVRHLGDDAGAISRLRIGTLGTAMLQVAQHRQSARDGLMTAFAGEVGDKTDTAGVVLVPGVIKAGAGPEKGGCHQRSCRLVRFARGGIGTTLAREAGQHWP